jgi:DNA-binding NtrC family response regulator
LGWIRAGKLKAYRVPGGRHRIARAEFKKFLADNQIPLTLDPPPPRRVMVVDDDPAVRDAFEAALRAKRCEVVLASDGPEALASLQAGHFDLIFLDIFLPSHGRASLIGEVKRRDPEAVVVLITGFPHHEEAMASLKFGPAMLLPKPIKIADIDAVLKIVFEEPRAVTE